MIQVALVRPDLELSFVEALYTAFAPQEGHLLYDWIILDTPPSVSLFTRAALAAADYILTPFALDTRLFVARSICWRPNIRWEL